MGFNGIIYLVLLWNLVQEVGSNEYVCIKAGIKAGCL